jgi:hypothetical protein
MPTTKNFTLTSLVRGLALAALAAAAPAGSLEYAQGDATGAGPQPDSVAFDAADSALTLVFYRVAGAGPQGALHGVVGFDITNSEMGFVFDPPRGIRGAKYNAMGDYDEVDLFVISFWSFQGDDSLGDNARGSGIRLLFGLLLFGSLQDSNDGLHIFSGPFDSTLSFP